MQENGHEWNGIGTWQSQGGPIWQTTGIAQIDEEQQRWMVEARQGDRADGGAR